MRIALTLALLVWIAPCAAQQVYKCTDASGNPVYSQRPCADDPEKLEVVDTSRAQKTGSGPIQAPTDAEQAARQIGLQASCDRRKAAVTARYRDELAEIDAQIDDYEAKKIIVPGVLFERRRTLMASEAADMKEAENLCRRERGG